jgi:hypothetical protein
MNDEIKDLKTWWKAGDFLLAPAPCAYSSLPAGNIPNWPSALKNAGYTNFAHYGDEFDPLSVKVWRYQPENHLLVEIWNESNGLSLFFVAAPDSDMFFATWYVSFVRDATVARQRDVFDRIAKILIAFVRHGHGPDTIDEYGDESLDEYEHRREREKAKQKDGDVGNVVDVLP